MDAQILDSIAEFYLNSDDFNGIPAQEILRQFGIDHAELKPILVKLVLGNEAGVVFGDHHPNMHIRALPDHPVEVQIDTLNASLGPDYCVYPTRKSLEGRVDHAKYAGKPYSLELALGDPQLSFRPFDISVLEFYRNDPRFWYRTSDICGSLSVSSERDEGGTIIDHDRVILQSFGFCFDANMNRAVAVFLRYLHDLTPEHQQIWAAKELRQQEYHLHPDYHRASFQGHYGECISLFDAFLIELDTLNRMAAAMGREPLFRDSYKDRPKEFGWILRPTSKAYEDFVRLLDKMLSDNINKRFFGSDLDLKEESPLDDGRVQVREKGTIRLLHEWIESRFTQDKGPVSVEDAIKILKRIRKERGPMAHTVNDDRFDSSIPERQRQLMIETYGAVRILRLAFGCHPACRAVEIDPFIAESKIWMY